MLNYYIDIAKESDASDVCNVLRKSIKEVCGLDYLDLPDSFMESWLKNKTSQNIKQWITDDFNILLVARTYDNKVIGVASIDKKGKILLCYVLPEFIGKGVEKLLLDGMINIAIDWKLIKLCSYSTRTAKEFYLKNGFIDLCEYTIESDKIIEYKLERVLK